MESLSLSEAQKKGIEPEVDCAVFTLPDMWYAHVYHTFSRLCVVECQADL